MRLPLSQSAPAVGIAAAAGPAGSHAAPRGLTGASSRSSVRPMGSRAHVGCSGVATCGCVGGAGGRARQQLQMRRLWAPTPALQPLRRSQAPLSRGMAVVAAAKGVGKPKKDDSPYKDTVNLPDTKFNMRANSVKREPELQRQWAAQRTYETLRDANKGEVFTLHDGPPYANGDLHIGHALNKVLKDIIVKYQLLAGRKVKFIPGWDCHGLPIELKVLQSMTAEQREKLEGLKLRYKARDFALKTVAKQRDQFKRYGVWAEWEEPYLTLNPGYEAAQLGVFGRMFLNGHIYRGRKPVHWSPSSRTALAEAELEYPPDHFSRSIYVALPLQSLGEEVPAEVAGVLQGGALAVWTTTPWTMPANKAVAVNGKMQYAVVRGPGGRVLVVAEDLVDALGEKLEATLERLATLTGQQLAGSRYSHPLDASRVASVLVGGDYVTADSGTGLVHSAPGHGQEDYMLGLQHGLELLSPVDDAGNFTAEAGPEFEGLNVLDEGNTAVIKALEREGALLKEERYKHKYAYDWRTKQPCIFRCTDQWFASVEGFREEALEAIKGVRWLPASGQNRISRMTESRTDWCISRQRKWGVPIPVFYDKESGEPLMSEATIEHVQKVVGEKGSDAWWQLPLEDLLPPELRDQAPRLVKGEDTMDVWFDSGTSWAGCVAKDPALSLPADLYLEGSDQHRGWFQSSLLTSVAATGAAPYKTVLTHGFVLDEKGVKMSKSIGNVVDPRIVMEGGKDVKTQPPYGADVLRLWVASVDATSGDVGIGPGILNQTADTYRKLRFTVRFLLGNLNGFNPATDSVPYDQLPATDRYMLSRAAAVFEELRSSFENYQFARFYQAVQRFVVNDLSNFYLDVAKDRMYVRGIDSPDRRACQTVLAAVLQGLLPALAPVTPHMAEDAWSHLPWEAHVPSVFQGGWQSSPVEWTSIPEEEASTFRSLLAIRGEVNQVLEKARTGKLLGAALEARVVLHVADPSLRARLAALDASPNGADPLRYAFIVSQVELVELAAEAEGTDYSAALEVEGVGALTVGIARARGGKCQRCWNYSEQVGSVEGHPALCERCGPVIKASGFQLPEPTAELATA